MNAELNEIAGQHGFAINSNNGIYKRGRSYDMPKKMEVAAALQASQHPNISDVSKQCKVSTTFVRKILTELVEHGELLPPDQKRRHKTSGPGAKTLDEIDAYVILLLYMEEPSRGLHKYALWLEYFTGTRVSTSVLSRFFNDAFPYGGGLYRPNLIPYDKFRPENCIRAIDYFEILAKINPYRIKFGDEKSLKGREVFNRKVRRNPLTGEIPPIPTNPDFTNTYSLIGFCGIDRRSTPVFCNIHDETNDASEFSIAVELACAVNFFNEGDVLVLDNAAIHCGGDNSVLEEWLWDRFGVLVLLLPPRSPELNPIELVWNTMVQRLRTTSLRDLFHIGAHSTAVKSIEILSEITHREVESYYNKAGI